MIGKAHAAMAFLPAHDPDREIADATSAFAETRSLVAQGWPDPDELGLASLGEEARLHLRVGSGICGWKELVAHAACAAELTPQALEAALSLYARQAAAESTSGDESLRFLLGWVSGQERLVTALSEDPFSRKLLNLYTLAYDDDDDLKKTALKALAGATRKTGSAPGDKTELLAVAAYRLGQFDLARDFATGNSTPLAAWVRAKLAVAANDLTGAASAYAEATKGFPVLTEKLDPEIEARIRGEQGVLALSRGEFVQAFSYLFTAAEKAGPDSGVAYDASYVAERVLTTDELKAYVDRHIPASSKPLPPEEGVDAPAKTMGDTIRLLLARRLVRDQRLDQALPYFPEADDPRYATWEKKHLIHPFLARDQVRAYAKALSEARSRWTDTGRAEAWFAAARLVQEHGMEIMGSEQAPDFTVFGGSFGVGAGQDLSEEARASAGEGAAEGRNPAATSRAFIKPEERARFAQSAVTPDKRFHYRWVAVEYAVSAANLLPTRSQAFAAVLCQAAGWQTDRTQELYKRYVAQGALVPFSRQFGHECSVTPRFDEAQFYTPRHFWSRVKNKILRHL